MKKFTLFVATLSLLSLALADTANVAPAPLKIGIIGDSTVSNYKESMRQRGWGQLLPDFLQAGVVVINEAKPGRSTKTFANDLWQRVLTAKPDFILIQFGHNDSHDKGKPESTDAATDYRENLRRFVREAREAGATPVLVTPVRRRIFGKDGKLSTELAPYVEAMKIVAAELNVPVIDLHTTSGALYERLGEQGSDAFTLNQADNADRPGKGDRTHFTENGAREIARLVATDLARLDPRLAAVVRGDPAAR